MKRKPIKSNGNGSLDLKVVSIVSSQFVPPLSSFSTKTPQPELHLTR